MSLFVLSVRVCRGSAARRWRAIRAGYLGGRGATLRCRWCEDSPTRRAVTIRTGAETWAGVGPGVGAGLAGLRGSGWRAVLTLAAGVLVEIALVEIALIEIALGAITFWAARHRSIRLRACAGAIRPTIVGAWGVGILPASRSVGPIRAGAFVHPLFDAFADHQLDLTAELGVSEHFVDQRAHLVLIRRGPIRPRLAVVTLCALRRVTLKPPLVTEHLTLRHRPAGLGSETRLATPRLLGLSSVRLRAAFSAWRAFVPLIRTRRTLRLSITPDIAAL